MANILPETEVRGSLLQIYPEPKVRGISNCKLPMIEVEGSMIHGIHHLTPYYGAYNIYYSGQADYISGFCFQYCIFEFGIGLASVIAAAF